MGSGVSKQVHETTVAELQAENAQTRQQKDAEIAELRDQLEQKERSIQEQERIIEADREEQAQLQRTQSELLDVKEQYEAQIAETAAQIQSAADAHAELESSLADLQSQYEDEKANHEQDKAELNHTIELAQQAFQALPAYAKQIEENLDLTTVKPMSPDINEEVHNAITQRDNSILPEGINDAIGQFQDNMRNLKAMQAAVAQSQDKVTEYWKKVQAHEALLLEQKRHILSIENKNEQLKMNKATKKMQKFEKKNSAVSLTQTGQRKPKRQSLEATHAPHNDGFVQS